MLSPTFIPPLSHQAAFFFFFSFSLNLFFFFLLLFSFFLYPNVLLPHVFPCLVEISISSPFSILVICCFLSSLSSSNIRIHTKTLLLHLSFSINRKRKKSKRNAFSECVLFVVSRRIRNSKNTVHKIKKRLFNGYLTSKQFGHTCTRNTTHLRQAKPFKKEKTEFRIKRSKR